MTTVIEKPWGKEEWIENNDKYVVKKLFMDNGHQCSLQFHEEKHETVCVLKGSLCLIFGIDIEKLEEKILEVGDYFIIPPKTIHRMKALENSVYLECSTPQLNDVVRIKDDYGR